MRGFLRENFKILLCFCMVLLVVIAYCSVEFSKLAYKEKVRQETLKAEKKLQKDLHECLLTAIEDKDSYWNKTCKDFGKKDDCLLPAYNADSVEKSYKEDRKECMDKFKNRAFFDYKNLTAEEIEELYGKIEDKKD